jgi:hypothetical protein
MLKKKMWANFKIIIELFNQKIVTKLSKIQVLGSGIRKKTYSGSRIQGSKRHQDPQHWIITIPGGEHRKLAIIWDGGG